MANKLYRDQIAKHISPAFSLKSGWDDTNAAENALEWFVAYLKGHLEKCLQTEKTGVCDMTWKHDDCALLMSILYDLTQDVRYVPKHKWTPI